MQWFIGLSSLLGSFAVFLVSMVLTISLITFLLLEPNVALACKGEESGFQGFLKWLCSFPTIILLILCNYCSFLEGKISWLSRKKKHWDFSFHSLVLRALYFLLFFSYFSLLTDRNDISLKNRVVFLSFVLSLYPEYLINLDLLMFVNFTVNVCCLLIYLHFLQIFTFLFSCINLTKCTL